MSATIHILLDEPIATISPLLHGHFVEHLGSCINGGIWVGEDSAIPNIGGIRSDVVEALRQLAPPVLRWPGGCFADDYHWRDGIGPRKSRPRTVNIWWGQTIEDNAFGTHEFFNLCRLIGAEPYLAGNVGSGTPREMRDWMEYCNFAGDSTLAKTRAANGSPHPFNVKFWGVGNESWGCGGNMCPEDYAALYKRYATYLPAFSGVEPFLIACGPNGNDAEWTRRFFKKIGPAAEHWNRRLHGFAAHFYTWNSDARFGTATEFTIDQWYAMLHAAAQVDLLIVQQRAILDEFDPQRKIGLILDEWGAWQPPTPGKNPAHLWVQNSLRDALVAAMTLDVFNRHADKLAMANLAQAVNVLHSLILTEAEKMLRTPTYHVFDLYQSHRGGQSVRTIFDDGGEITFSTEDRSQKLPKLTGSASVRGRELTLSVVNAHASLPVDASIDLRGAMVREATVNVLSADDITAPNIFDEPDRVRPRTESTHFDSGKWSHTFPPASVTVFLARLV